MAFGAKPHNIKMVGYPDEFAALNTPDTYEDTMKLVPPRYELENYCPGRALLTLISYKPIKKVHKIACPVLIQGSTEDTFIDIKALRKTVKISNCQYVEYECGILELMPVNYLMIPLKQLNVLKECFNL